MKVHDDCIFCGSSLKPFQRLLGRCGWCMKALSDELQQSDASLAMDMSYSFCNDDEDESNEEN